MPSDLYLARARFQRSLDERWPGGGWLVVMATDEIPGGPSMVSTGIMGAVGRVLVAGSQMTEDPETPDMWQLMFDFRSYPLEVWEEHRPWTCWTDGRFTRVANRPDVWRWWALDPDDGDRLEMVCYLDARPDGERAVTAGHRQMANERAADLFPEGLDLGSASG